MLKMKFLFQAVIAVVSLPMFIEAIDLESKFLELKERTNMLGLVKTLAEAWILNLSIVFVKTLVFTPRRLNDKLLAFS